MLKMSTHIFDIFDNIFQCGIIPSATPEYSMGLDVSPECFNVHSGRFIHTIRFIHAGAHPEFSQREGPSRTYIVVLELI